MVAAGGGGDAVPVGGLVSTGGHAAADADRHRPLHRAHAQPISPWLERYLAAGREMGLAQIALLYLLALTIGLAADFTQQFLMQRTGQHAMFELRRRVMAHLQALDIAFYDRNPVGRLVTRVTTDADALNELFTSGLITIFGDVLVLVFVFGAMLRLSLGLTLVMLAMMPLVFTVTVFFRRAVTAGNRRIRVAVARINAFLQEHINGITVLQLFNREQRAAADFEKVNREHMDAYKTTVIAYGWFYPAVEFLSLLAIASILARGGWQVRHGGSRSACWWRSSNTLRAFSAQSRI